MNDETLNKRLDARASVLGSDTPSLDTLCRVFMDFQTAAKKWKSQAETADNDKLSLNNTKKAHSALVKEVMKHQYDVEKASRTLLRCRKESKYYTDLTETTEGELESTKKEIDALKIKLQEARDRREEKIEYEKNVR